MPGPVYATFEFPAGDPVAIVVTCLDAAGDPLVGVTATLTIASTPPIIKAATTNSSGVATFTLVQADSAALTGNFQFDVVVTSPRSTQLIGRALIVAHPNP